MLLEEEAAQFEVSAVPVHDPKHVLNTITKTISTVCVCMCVKDLRSVK